MSVLHSTSEPPSTSGTEAAAGVSIDELIVSGIVTGAGSILQKQNQVAHRQGRPEAHGAGSGASEAGDNGAGSSPDPNSFQSVVSEIRAKVEKFKKYPEAARRLHLGGKAVVRFGIDQNGALAFLEVMQSSGSTLLDEAALDTVRRAAPYPKFSSPLSLALRFEP